MSNIRDVAKLSGHSVSTVSRVINNRSYVASETKAEILAAMKELNYHPNDIARALSTGKTYQVGVVLPYSNHPYFQKLIAAINNVAFKEDYQVMLLPSDYNAKSEIRYLEMLKHQAFDGLIFTSRAISFEKIMEYQQYGSITCCEDTLDYPISCAYTNKEELSVQVLQALKQAGFERIGVTVGRDEFSSRSAKAILDSYKLVFGKPIAEKYLIRNTQYLNDGMNAVQTFVDRGADLDIFYANGDQVAAGVIHQLKVLGMDMPVIGQDNMDYSYLMNFSTIDHKLKEIGEYAFWSLFEKDVIKKKIPSEFISRGELKDLVVK